ncbi:transcriptional regulator with a Cro/C1-type helix-turn-helix domain [Synechococcus sp. BIOS-U3-1]|uniref:helix-turn-helix domain-containing protein n=1 Tax=Synechococcus sp. BIOS-U3-1 TaxID=1400865 RepID=UPI000C5AC01E|nr:helix-turn-helix domain-containing protein [Synechococcus sp. BIOS-U3-1]MAD68179.1 XRE family transcriptional regulator [Synechococcus sp. CPC100]QNI59406.1 transcriptional regulator with a Cro/C1-type helix-turn-helix domain [Synechococcus sp. BIOS-U3-1]|tara:strand:+ start:4150 stop:4956 length:807 start_codon:yes stop_codon:yes gene_type:complete
MWLSDSEQAKDGATISTLQEIGELLRQARVEQGLSCEQLAQSLKMGSEQLQALESGDLERLPEPVFIKAMTRRVASKLGLDDDSLISRLQDVLPAPKTANSQSSSLPGGGATNSAAANGRVAMGLGSSKKPDVPWQRLALVALAIGAVTGGAMVIASQRRALEPASLKATNELKQPTTTTPQPVAPDQKSAAQISISSQEPSWVLIRNGEGDVVYEGTLSDPKLFPADAKLEILPGRPDLVLMSHGEDAPRALGPIHQVRWYKLNPER